MLDLSKLTARQNELRSKIKILKFDKELKILAGCDSALILDKNQIISVFVIFSYPDLEILDIVKEVSELTMPYISGFLAFREIPNILKAYEKLKHEPDLIMVDGHGIAHPRRMGIASHLGVLIEKPTIGVGKSKLYGKFDMPCPEKGCFSELNNKDELLGYALRSKDYVKPIFVSPGNLIDAKSALEITISTLRKHKLPEPTRLADFYSKKLKT